MKTFIERIEEKRNTCVTIDDWEKAFDWLANEVSELNDESLRMQSAIREKYGEKALDELIEMAMDDEFEITPAMEAMFTYGYKNMDMMPLDKETAVKFFGKNCNVFILYPNNTEKKANSVEDILSANEMIGVSVSEIAEKIAIEADFIINKEPD